MEKIDKIYFDIDGVLKGTASPQEDIISLLRYCLDNYTGSLYWLTTHCKGNENHTDFALSDTLPKDPDMAKNSSLPQKFRKIKLQTSQLLSYYL